MKPLDLERYKCLMSYVKKYALALNAHERVIATEYPEKRSISLHEMVQTNFPITQCFDYSTSGFVMCFNNSFYQTVCLYEECIKSNPNAFKSADALSILNTIYEKSNYWSNFGDYQEYLQTESCCYIILTNGNTFGEILRVDLYRKLDNDEDGKIFTGGLFHCLKHFSMDGVNLSYGSDINETFDIMHIVYLLGKAFKEAINNNSDDGIIKIDHLHIFIAHFFCEKESSVYFVKTLRKGKLGKKKDMM